MSWTLIIKSKDGAHAKFKASQDQVCGIINRVMGLLPMDDCLGDGSEGVSADVYKRLQSEYDNLHAANRNNLRQIDEAGKVIRRHSDTINKLYKMKESCLAVLSDVKVGRNRLACENSQIEEIIEDMERTLKDDANSETEANS